MSQVVINFMLRDIEVISKTLIQQPPSFAGVPSFDIKIEIKVQADKKVLLTFVYITIRRDDNMDVLANFTIVFAYEIINFENDIKLNEENLYQIPPNFDDMLKTVSLSTSRGILYSELRGTYLHGAILPVVFIKGAQILQVYTPQLNQQEEANN